MSKYMVAFYNATNETIQFANTEDSNNDRIVLPKSMFTTKVHFNVPDNNDSSSNFDGHHMEIKNEHGDAIFSFWDDPDNNYVLMYCKGTDWKNTTAKMPGTALAGNEQDVGIVLTGSGPDYEIKSCAAKYGV
jgi:hypothetical protein